MSKEQQDHDRYGASSWRLLKAAVYTAGILGTAGAIDAAAISHETGAQEFGYMAWSTDHWAHAAGYDLGWLDLSPEAYSQKAEAVVSVLDGSPVNQILDGLAIADTIVAISAVEERWRKFHAGQ